MIVKFKTIVGRELTGKIIETFNRPSDLQEVYLIETDEGTFHALATECQEVNKTKGAILMKNQTIWAIQWQIKGKNKSAQDYFLGDQSALAAKKALEAEGHKILIIEAVSKDEFVNNYFIGGSLS